MRTVFIPSFSDSPSSYITKMQDESEKSTWLSTESEKISVHEYHTFEINPIDGSLHVSKLRPHVFNKKLEFSNLFDEWLTRVEDLTFNKDVLELVDLLSSSENNKFSLIFSKSKFNKWDDTFKKIDAAVASYAAVLDESSHAKPLCAKSIRYLLHLVPVLSQHRPNISIDADTGYFAAMFDSTDQGLMTVLVTPKGELHFSLVERGRKLVKISGTAKIKDVYDLKKFNKVLSML